MKTWTPEDILQLKQSYPKLGLKETALLLKCSENSVRRKASLLHLKVENNKRFWADEELEFLKNNFESFGCSKCSEILKRSRNSVAKQACRLKLKQQQDWTQEQLNFLKDNYSLSGPFILSKELNRTYRAVVKQASLLKLQAPKISGYSRVAIEWLNSFNNSNILHAENGGEQKVLGYYVDGYDPKTNTVYEFHGDKFHGNLDIFDIYDTPNPFDKRKTAEELWQKTFERMKIISKAAEIIYIWESDYRKGNSYERF